MALQSPAPPHAPGRVTAWLTRLMPHSLRGQFAFALATMGLLIVLGGSTAFLALHGIGSAARQASQERLKGMHDAQDLQLHTQEIQLLADSMMAAPTRHHAQQTYDELQTALTRLDELMARLAVSDGVSLLDLHMAAQLFRNSAHVIAYLRDTEAASTEAAELRSAALSEHRLQMQTQARTMVRSAREQSDQLTRAYEEAVLRVVDASRISAYWVVGWLAVSLVLAWLIGHALLGRHVVGRLQQVSRSLRSAQEGAAAGAAEPQVPVHGDDEIGQMARSVERFLCDRRQLALTRTRLEEEQQRLATIIDNTADSIVVLGEGRVLQINRAAEAMFGLSPAEAAGLPIDELLSGLDPGASGGAPREATARHRSGRTVPVEVSSNPLAGSAGALAVLVIRDATLRRQAEQHLIDARDAAEAARATQSAFLASMSHELRTPLNGVLGYAQILELDRGLSQRQRFAVTTIRTSGEHLLALINDLLDLAKHDAGRLELCPTEVRLLECLRLTADIVRVKAEEAGLRFFTEIADDVPSGVVTDEKRLRQVLLNLLSNAVKFTDRGTVTLRVSRIDTPAPVASGVRKGEPELARLRFEVIDSGIGMQPDQLHRIFEPFEQVGEAQRRSIGSGLGLAISRQLVRLMGSDIQVSSAPGQGTHFSFDVEMPVVAQPTLGPAGAPTIIGYRGPARRVLVVDDIAANRLVLGAMLRPLGFEVEEAADGQQALDRARATPPDLILMDIDMPVMSGPRAIGLIRQIDACKGLPIIAMSATVDADEVSIGAGSDADVFLPKPIERERLLQETARLLALEWVQGWPVAEPAG